MSVCEVSVEISQAAPRSVVVSLWVDGVEIADKTTTAGYIQNLNLSSHDRSALFQALPWFFIECNRHAEGKEEPYDWRPYLNILVDILRTAATTGTNLCAYR